MRKKIFYLFLSAIFLTQGVQAFYSDVSLGSIIYPGVKYLTEKQLIQGYEDGTFGVDVTINRAEALKLILIATEKPLIQAEESFPDVPVGSWFEPYVSHAKAKGIVSGESSGNFVPAREVNRAEFIKMLLEAFEVDPSEHEMDISLKDVPAGSWFEPYMNFAVFFGILVPGADQKVNPAEFLTRGEAAYLLYKTMEKGRGLDPQLLMNLAERHLIYSLQTLSTSKEVVQPGLATAVAKNYTDALLDLLPSDPTVKGASLTTKAINNLVGAYIAADNGLPDDVIKAAQMAWGFADEAQQMDLEQLQEIAFNIKQLAETIAGKARELKSRVEE